MEYSQQERIYDDGLEFMQQVFYGDEPLDDEQRKDFISHVSQANKVSEHDCVKYIDKHITDEATQMRAKLDVGIGVIENLESKPHLYSSIDFALKIAEEATDFFTANTYSEDNRQELEAVCRILIGLQDRHSESFGKDRDQLMDSVLQKVMPIIENDPRAEYIFQGRSMVNAYMRQAQRSRGSFFTTESAAFLAEKALEHMTPNRIHRSYEPDDVESCLWIAEKATVRNGAIRRMAIQKAIELTAASDHEPRTETIKSLLGIKRQVEKPSVFHERRDKVTEYYRENTRDMLRMGLDIVQPIIELHDEESQEILWHQTAQTIKSNMPRAFYGDTDATVSISKMLATFESVAPQDLVHETKQDIIASIKNNS